MINKHTNAGLHRCPAHRRGSAYLLVLGATMIVTTMAVGGALVLSSEVQSQNKRRELVQASVSAQSVLELSVLAFNNTAAERKALSDGAAIVSARIGGVKCVARASATDGSNISADPDDEFAITAYAEGLHASQGLRADITPISQTPDSFDAAIHAGGTITINKADVSGGPMIGAGGDISGAANSTISLPVYSSGLIAGGTFTAGTSANVTAKVMPSTEGLEYYASRATPIAYASIPNGKIDRCVIGPGLNPFGAADANGLYSIDCGGGNLTICDSRIAASLIVWNVGTLTVAKSVHWTTPNKRYPALGMRGTTFSLNLTDISLSEQTSHVNFTPLALPFEGVGDTTMTSVLPNTMRGAFYIEGDVNVKTILPLEGVMVCTGNLAIENARVTLNRPIDFEVPPGLVPLDLSLPVGVARVTR